MPTAVSPPAPADVDALREELLEVIRKADWRELYAYSDAITDAAPPPLDEDADAEATVGYRNGEPVSVRDVMARSDSADRAIAEGRVYTLEQVRDFLKQRRSNPTA